MKKIFCACIIALYLSCDIIFAQNISDLEAFEKAIKPGTQLTYDVSAKTQQYQLIITLKKLGDEISFDWKTTDSNSRSGTVVMNTNAISNAEALFHTFTGGTATLDKETSLVISKQVFKKISTTSEASLKLAGIKDTLTNLSNTIGEFNFNLDGNLVAVPGWELESSGEPKCTLDILESTKFPLIYQLDFGWSLLLTDIKSQ